MPPIKILSGCSHIRANNSLQNENLTDNNGTFADIRAVKRGLIK
jgi:hypothetical protein